MAVMTDVETLFGNFSSMKLHVRITEDKHAAGPERSEAQSRSEPGTA